MCKGLEAREQIPPLNFTCRPSLLLGLVTQGRHGPRACLLQNSWGTLLGSSSEPPSLNIGGGLPGGFINLKEAMEALQAGREQACCAAPGWGMGNRYEFWARGSRLMPAYSVQGLGV